MIQIEKSSAIDIENPEKMSPELLCALRLDEKERRESLDLAVGYEEDVFLWELVVRHTGLLSELAESVDCFYIELLAQYGILRIRESRIEKLLRHPQLLYVEKPKRLYEERILPYEFLRESCMTSMSRRQNKTESEEEIKNKTGNETGNTSEKKSATEQEKNNNIVIHAVIDSGIDLYHPQFIREDNTSKVSLFWNQNQEGNPPEPYGFGCVYTQEDINHEIAKMIENPADFARLEQRFSFDRSGHGTAVSSIVTDLAKDVELVVVGVRQDTAALMCGIDFAVRYALEENRPLVINLSYGNNYGSHSGDSLLETYLDAVSSLGKINVVTGMGNDGNTGRHARIYSEKTMRKAGVSLLVEQGLLAFNLQLWSPYTVSYTLSLTLPDGREFTADFSLNEKHSYQYKNMKLLVQSAAPSPLNRHQEMFLSIFALEGELFAGRWEVTLKNLRGQGEAVDLYLPVAQSTSADVSFETESPFATFTVPAASKRCISVGAYDPRRLTLASFSGLGYTADNQVKPDLAAPGVRIPVAQAGGGETVVSGTSFATPFVSAAAARLMTWGITEGNDPFLYGERLKAALHRSAKPLPAYREYPNPYVGYGALCANTDFM